MRCLYFSVRGSQKSQPFSGVHTPSVLTLRGASMSGFPSSCRRPRGRPAPLLARLVRPTAAGPLPDAPRACGSFRAGTPRQPSAQRGWRKVEGSWRQHRSADFVR
ncbi:unnamed protein product, partial [Prorocentrum cordatum]